MPKYLIIKAFDFLGNLKHNVSFLHSKQTILLKRDGLQVNLIIIEKLFLSYYSAGASSTIVSNNTYSTFPSSNVNSTLYSESAAKLTA